MPSQHAIELFGLLNFTVIGLSLLFRPLQWARFFAWLRREGEAGALAYGFICLSFGSLIVSFHRVWHGLLVIFTVAGWLEVLLGVLCLLIPSAGLGIMGLAAEDRPTVCRLGGLVSLAVAAVILVALVSGGGL
jgi:hypothetical protein